MSRSRFLQVSLHGLELLAFATLVRSVLFGFWTTVVATLLLLGGSFVVHRGRTWGLGVLLAAATAFPSVAMLGIAPQWFWLVGIAGAAPFAIMLRPMARFDASATATLMMITGIVGVASAFAWRSAALAMHVSVHACR